MPLVQIPTLRVAVKNKKLSIMALRKLGLESPKVIRSTFKTTAEKINAKMQVPGKPITYPVQWDSAKQRRAFFATDGFGGGIPHVRKGFYVSQWQATTIRGGYQVANKWNRAGYIAGDIKGERQSRIHKGRWPVFRRIVDAALKLIPKRIVSDLKVMVKKIGFRVRQ
jgi:hypothetical protein